MPSKRLSSINASTYKWLALASIAVGLFTSVADIGSVVVALPTISTYFGTNLPTSQWVVIGYALTISCLLLPMGRLSDMVGRKKIYITGFVIFVIGGILGAFSTNMTLLILFRVLMGVGAAMTQGTSMAMVVGSFPASERGKALGLQMSVVGIGGVAGPVMGGFIVDAVGWRGVFFTTASLGILSIIAAQIFLDGRKLRQSDKSSAFDWVGAMLSTSALVVCLLALSHGPSVGWGSPLIIVALVGFLALLGGFIVWELHVPTPMLDVRLFRIKLFSLGVTTAFISFLGISSVRFLMPFYLQAVLGHRPREVGIIMVPAAFAMIIMGALGGRLSDRYGWTRFNVGGLALSATGLLMLSRLTVDSSLGWVIVSMVIQSSGTATFNAPNASSVLSTVEPSRYGVISGFHNLVRNSATITGIAVVTAVVTAVMASTGYPPSLSSVSNTNDGGVLVAFTNGLRSAYMVMGVLVIVGAVLSLAKGRRQRERSMPEAVTSRPIDQDGVSSTPTP